MRTVRWQIRVDAPAVRAALASLRRELAVPADHPAAAHAEAAAAIGRGPQLPPQAPGPWVDAVDLDLVTVDPPGSRDLDQALHLERRGDGYRVHYAIADVAAFVAPGGVIDQEAWARGTTLYLPDGSAPLHPPELSEGAASLLAARERRPAVLWTLDLDSDGSLVGTDVRRAWVRSRRQLTYDEAQRMADSGSAQPGGLELLAVVGRLRQAQELERGGVSLQLPEQDVVAEDGRYELAYRRNLPAENWNAQLSLLTGMAAAALMASAGTGVLRVLPDAQDDALEGLRRRARALGVRWPADESYPAFVRALDPAVPVQAALLQQAAKTLRGAGYVVLEHAGAPVPRHAAVASPYAHVTAPLRRLVDRYGSEVALSVCAGVAVPDWVQHRLADLPAAMAAAGQRSSQVDNAALDLVEALVLAGHQGRRFTASVVDSSARASKVQLADPAVVASVVGPLPLGSEVALELVAVDVAARRVELVVAQPPAAPNS